MDGWREGGRASESNTPDRPPSPPPHPNPRRRRRRWLGARRGEDARPVAPPRRGPAWGYGSPQGVLLRPWVGPPEFDPAPPPGRRHTALSRLSFAN
jgi:hypothetical protein